MYLCSAFDVSGICRSIGREETAAGETTIFVEKDKVIWGRVPVYGKNVASDVQMKLIFSRQTHRENDLGGNH